MGTHCTPPRREFIIQTDKQACIASKAAALCLPLSAQAAPLCVREPCSAVGGRLYITKGMMGSRIVAILKSFTIPMIVPSIPLSLNLLPTASLIPVCLRAVSFRIMEVESAFVPLKFLPAISLSLKLGMKSWSTFSCAIINVRSMVLPSQSVDIVPVSTLTGVFVEVLTPRMLDSLLSACLICRVKVRPSNVNVFPVKPRITISYKTHLTADNNGTCNKYRSETELCHHQ